MELSGITLQKALPPYHSCHSVVFLSKFSVSSPCNFWSHGCGCVASVPPSSWQSAAVSSAPQPLLGLGATCSLWKLTCEAWPVVLPLGCSSTAKPQVCSGKVPLTAARAGDSDSPWPRAPRPSCARRAELRWHPQDCQNGTPGHSASPGAWNLPGEVPDLTQM